MVEGETESVTVPAWVTVTVWSVAPVAETVTVAARGVALVFEEFAVTVIVRLPEPEVAETSSQLAASARVHEVFEVISKVPVDPEAADRGMVEGETESVTVPAWVTVTVWVDTPPVPEMVIIAVRSIADIFSSAVTVIVASVIPVVGETESHAASSIILHVVSDAVILNVPVAPATAVNGTVAGETVSVCPWSFASAATKINEMVSSFFIFCLYLMS